MSKRTKSAILSLVILPVLTGQMVLVLTLSALLHFATDDHDHEIVTHSEIGALSVERDHLVVHRLPFDYGLTVDTERSIV
jgi:hypothetical protein